MMSQERANKIIEKFIEILSGQLALSDEDLVQNLENANFTSKEAKLIVGLLPSAFGRILVKELGVSVPDEFQVAGKNGEKMSYVFSKFPFSSYCQNFAVNTFSHGPSSLFKLLAERSAEVAVVNQALNAGLEVRGSKLRPTFIYGVTAEEMDDDS